MKWQDWLAVLLVICSAGIQSAISPSSHFAALFNFPMVAVALLSTYPRVHILLLTSILVVTRIATGTENIPITIFRTFIATYLSIKAGLRLINHGWLLAVITVTSCIGIDLLAAIIAHPKYAATMSITDIVMSVVFNAVITLLCAVPMELYYRKKHLFGF